MDLSVIIPTHNPRMDYLNLVLEGLSKQSLPTSQWELIVVDNCSSNLLTNHLDITWHQNARVVREENLGLTHARIHGFRQSIGNLIVLVDDDNVLADDYLEEARIIASSYPHLGSWSGNQELVYEQKEFAIHEKHEYLIGGRRVTSAIWSNDLNHHASTPWGAGMCVRRVVATEYLKRLDDKPYLRKLDLIGERRIYGGDTDIAYTGCTIGYGKGVFPQLKLRHLISANRCTEDYLIRVTEGHSYSAVVHTYLMTGIIDKPRTDWRAYLMSFARWFGLSSFERRMSRARLEGQLKAIQELTK